MLITKINNCVKLFSNANKIINKSFVDNNLIIHIKALNAIGGYSETYSFNYTIHDIQFE